MAKPAEHPSPRETLAVICSLPADDADIYLPADVATGPDAHALTYGDLRTLQRQLEALERYRADEQARERREFVRAYVIKYATRRQIPTFSAAISDARQAWTELQEAGL